MIRLLKQKEIIMPVLRPDLINAAKGQALAFARDEEAIRQAAMKVMQGNVRRGGNPIPSGMNRTSFRASVSTQLRNQGVDIFQTHIENTSNQIFKRVTHKTK